MRRATLIGLLVCLLCLLLLAARACAEEPKVGDGSFAALAAVTVASAIFDGWTTERAIHHGAFEGNPILRPFAKRPAALYGALLATSVGELAYAHHERNRCVRGWYLLPLVASASHGVAGGFNLRIH